MSRAISWTVVFAGAALALALVASAIRVAALEARELEAVGAWRAAAGGPRLVEATLLRGDEVTFELCARDAMEAERWGGAGTLAVVRADRDEEMFSLPIDAPVLAGVARGDAEACVVFARVDELAIDEAEVPVAVELSRAEAAIDDVPVRGRILARHPLGDLDLGLVLLALAMALALVLALMARPAERGHDGAPRGALRAVLGVGLVLAAGIAIGALGPGGPSAGLFGGVLLGAVEIGVAYALIRPAGGGARTGALGLTRPSRAPRWLVRLTGASGGDAMAQRAERFAVPYVLGWLVLAPAVGVVLFFVARIALAMVPSTGRAPIEAFVSWPSGMLSFAALAVVAPIAEEVFFRGLVFGTLRGEGGKGREALAVAGAWLLFAAAHAPQDWGHWGGLVSVLVAWLGFTVLRAASGTTLVPCLAHLVYNGLLAASALAAGAG